MPTFRNGQGRLKKTRLAIPNAGADFSAWLVQLVQIDKELGEDAARRFVAESETRLGLTPNELDFALSLLGHKR